MPEKQNATSSFSNFMHVKGLIRLEVAFFDNFVIQLSVKCTINGYLLRVFCSSAPPSTSSDPLQIEPHRHPYLLENIALYFSGKLEFSLAFISRARCLRRSSWTRRWTGPRGRRTAGMAGTRRIEGPPALPSPKARSEMDQKCAFDS